MNVVNWLFTPERATAERGEAIRWWEVRRIPYNLLVGTVGIVSIILMELIGSVVVKPGEDFVEPLGLLLGIVLFGLAANTVYTFGWVFELRMRGADPEKHKVHRIKWFRKVLSWSCALASIRVWLSVLAYTISKTAR